MRLDPQKHGAVPFWFWNGDQEEGELSRQMEMAASAGFKGLAIHARRGNQTEYMSERWLALTRHCCEEAIRLGLDIWLYDEEGFPSGTVGGRLQKDKPFYQQKQLRFGYAQGSQIHGSKDLVAVCDAQTYQPIDPGELSADHEVLAFHVAYLPRYVDTLKRDTAERFMDMTHRPYFRILKPYFGQPITHIYTDDLNSNLDRGPSLPYTEKLFDLFSDRFGYNLLEHLPKLVENLSGCERIRLDFRTLVMDLFLDEFVSPMHQWCEEHGVKFTGHLSGDEGDFAKSAHAFGATMPFYEHEDIPGIDDFLCSVPSGCYLDQLRNPRNHCPVILFKQASSVANQLKDGLCGCECLTFLGWGAALWGQSAYLNYELALGVNLFTHHDFSYATGGVAKRDCPPSYFFQQPYWPHYKHFHTAISRSSQLLKRGRFDADCLVIHPMSSCWMAMDGKQISIAEPFEPRIPSNHPSPMAVEDGLAEVSHQLLKSRVGFEFGDEWLMAKHAQVRNGSLELGDMIYSTVIIPPVSNLLQSTVKLLSEFQCGGGTLIAVQPSENCLVDGKDPGQPLFGSILRPMVLSKPEDLRDLSLSPSFDLEVREENSQVICHSRRVEDKREHFVLNASDQAWTIGWHDSLRAYDPVDNQELITENRRLTLPPFHCVHLLPELPEGASMKYVAATVFTPPSGQGTTIPVGSWSVTLDQPNLLLVDWCDGANGKPVFHTDRKALPEGDCRLKACLEIPSPTDITGVLGEASTLENLRVNGRPLPPPTRKHPASQDLLIADSADFFVAGLNVIEFDRQPGDVLFEPFYLMGNFGIKLVESKSGMRPELKPLTPQLGDLVENGLPFYWGGVTYETDLNIDEGTDWLDCGSVDGVVTLTINGIPVGCRYMAPYRFYIADHLRPGTNRLSLTLFNTAQNLFGPHRYPQQIVLNPLQPRGEKCPSPYYLAAFGIHGPVMVE